MSNLGSSLSSRFEPFGRIADIDGAVEAQRIAHATHPSEDVALAYAGTLHARYQRLRAEADVWAAVDVHRTLVGGDGRGQQRFARVRSPAVTRRPRRCPVLW
jgi:hypothetical protein